jgi:hypothetical protein
MRFTAARVADSLAASWQGQYPVIVQEAKQDCRTLPNAQEFSDRQNYFVVTYSEPSHSFCVIQYAPAVGAYAENAITLDENSGQNHGARIFSPARVVPVSHVYKALPDVVISMLDWRNELKRSGDVMTFKSETHASSSMPDTVNVGLNINLFDIRADVARKRNRINIALDVLLGVFVLSTLAAPGLAWRTYRKFNRRCSAYDRRLELKRFLRIDIDSFIRQARRDHHARQAETQTRTRAEDLARREREALRERIKYLLETSRHEGERREIEDCLVRNEPEELKRLSYELETQRRTRTPEERVALLLESLREYCAEEEFQQYAFQAEETLKLSGFRQAREFIVQAHDELKQASREIEESVPAVGGDQS